jgi:hypothetical protein
MNSKLNIEIKKEETLRFDSIRDYRMHVRNLKKNLPANQRLLDRHCVVAVFIITEIS